MRVLVACEFSGTVRDAFIAAGHDAMSCDLLPSEKPGPHYQGDVRKILDDGWEMMVAHPPCTRLANSGVRWITVPPSGRSSKSIWDELKEAAAFYQVLREAHIKKKALENPVMHFYASALLGRVKRHIVQPWWFGEPEFKATGFELVGLPPLKPTNRLMPPKTGTAEHKVWSRVHRVSPGPDRWKERSRTLPGVAAAMAEQWGAA